VFNSSRATFAPMTIASDEYTMTVDFDELFSE